MKFICLKSGFQTLDSMQSVGLGLLVWAVTDWQVTVNDCGLFYQVTTEKPFQTIHLTEALERLLLLPDVVELTAEHIDDPFVAIIDGALAWMFTSPGVRVPSVASVRRKSIFNPEVIKRAIDKWERLRTKVLLLTKRLSRRFGTSIEAVLAGYTIGNPHPVTFGPKASGGITIPLVLDPALGYAYRHPIPDGEVADKVNIAVVNPLITSLLLLLGSIYCMRAQEVSGRLVHIYIPILQQATINGAPMMPCLPIADCSSDEALMQMWLQSAHGSLTTNSEWAGLNYQILQTQGAQQSFSIGQGVLQPPKTTPSPPRVQLTRRWAGWLTLPPRQRPPGMEELIGAVLRREPGALMGHLRMTAIAVRRAIHPHWKMYGEDELEEALTMIGTTGDESKTLVAIIARERGTRRFGLALRSLGEHFSAIQRDLIADLDIACNRDQLLRVLARVAEHCEISMAKNRFAVVPDDDDLPGLLVDIEQHSVHTIVSLIILLAAVRYPRRQSNETSEGAKEGQLETV